MVGVICFIPCLLFILINVWRGNKIKSSLQYMLDGAKYELNIRTIATSLLCLMISLPYLLKVGLEILDFLTSYFAEWDINLVPADIQFNNPCAMGTLGNIDSIILNKRALINGQNRVESFRVDGKCYFS
jgi:hypothetical protein